MNIFTKSGNFLCVILSFGVPMVSVASDYSMQLLGFGRNTQVLLMDPNINKKDANNYGVVVHSVVHGEKKITYILKKAFSPDQVDAWQTDRVINYTVTPYNDINFGALESGKGGDYIWKTLVISPTCLIRISRDIKKDFNIKIRNSSPRFKKEKPAEKTLFTLCDRKIDSECLYHGAIALICFMVFNRAAYIPYAGSHLILPAAIYKAIASQLFSEAFLRRFNLDSCVGGLPSQQEDSLKMVQPLLDRSVRFYCGADRAGGGAGKERGDSEGGESVSLVSAPSTPPFSPSEAPRFSPSEGDTTPLLGDFSA